MKEQFSVDKYELEELIAKAVRKGLADVGLRATTENEADAVREDMRFLRRFRLGTNGVSQKVGMAVILALIGGLLTMLGYGAKVFIGK
jgi:hypothetical protein